jgi:hypothetical protein
VGVRARWLTSSLAAAALLAGACGGEPPRRERVARPCLPLAWIDEARGSVAVQYRALGDDAWLAVDLRGVDTVLYGQDRLASIGVRRHDRTVLVPALLGASSMEVEVVTEPERPFARGFVVGRLGRESLEGRVVEIDGASLRMCDRYADEVADVAFRDDEAALAGPFAGRRMLVRVEDGHGRVGGR